jgi:hypothetical protein
MSDAPDIEDATEEELVEADRIVAAMVGRIVRAVNLGPVDVVDVSAENYDAVLRHHDSGLARAQIDALLEPISRFMQAFSRLERLLLATLANALNPA